MGITVTLLAYHEAENLKWMLPELKKVIDSLGVETVEYLIVDSAKPTDDTEAVCREFGAKYINQEEPGYGGAYRTAIKYASQEYFLILDADGSQDYTQIHEMYKTMMSGADVVIGSRYVPGGKTDDARSSQIMSKILNFAFRIGIGVNVHDFSDSLRIYHTSDLKRLHLTSENFDISEEIILKLKLLKNNCVDIKEVPIAFKKREIGESKRALMKFIICFGQMLVFSIVLRALSGKRYQWERHDQRARHITDLLLYGVVGLLTTVVNVLVYLILDELIGYLLANLIAWIVSVIFAFVTNKTIVFNDWNWNGRIWSKQLLSFTGSRAITGVLDMLMLWLMVDVMLLNSTLAKIIDSVVVIILNYVLSKLFVFTQRGKAVGQ